MTHQPVCTTFNLHELGLLPSGWVADVRRVVDEHAYFVHLDGHSGTSRELEDTKGSDYYVVVGDLIAQELPWLYELYTGTLREMAEQVAGRSLITSTELKTSININTIRGIGGRYEWHVDHNPMDDWSNLRHRPLTRRRRRTCL